MAARALRRSRLVITTRFRPSVPNLPITSQILYERLKAKGVLVISGHHFFPGLKKDPWQHKHECIRISYAMDDTLVINGIKLIAEEIKSVMR